ncbi:sulfide/dihydroorotate dehydrogenase-like FAD/NAD-binding protein [Clostridium sp. DL1XJH146]
MRYEIIDCIDSGTEYCPCHLAESGECILCSQLSGKCFCDCVNWKGTCIYQEYAWNGYKAKEGRQQFKSKVVGKHYVNSNVILLSILVTNKLIKALLKPGAYVFVRNKNDEEYFNIPISIMDADAKRNIIKICIELKGVKTKNIGIINVNEEIIVKGPYWNGVFGLKHILDSKDGNVVIISRGIGQAPAVPIMKRLYSEGNKITLIYDGGNYEKCFINSYLELCNTDLIEINTLANNDISKELKTLINNLIEKNNLNLIHCSGPDYLIYKLMNLINYRVNYSCCNNAKMCCGEGVCGACTARYDGDVVKRLCKIQTDPENIFEGRRFI